MRIFANISADIHLIAIKMHINTKGMLAKITIHVPLLRCVRGKSLLDLELSLTRCSPALRAGSHLDRNKTKIKMAAASCTFLGGGNSYKMSFLRHIKTSSVGDRYSI